MDFFFTLNVSSYQQALGKATGKALTTNDENSTKKIVLKKVITCLLEENSKFASACQFFLPHMFLTASFMIDGKFQTSPHQCARLADYNGRVDFDFGALFALITKNWTNFISSEDGKENVLV